ncbi:EF-hand domain-containing protein [Lentzea sp. NPDC003310]|uniref:EF-hand domain-containing protein n=1 Tax=Lentzea sp. NPDC003310 TaxID=3154447 RepID=UPI0033B6FA84
MNEVLSHRIEATFAHYDADGNGVIELADLYALANRLMLGFGEPASSERGRELIETSDRFWDALVDRCDVDRDGQISLDEYRTAMTAVLADVDEFDDVFLEVSESLLALADADGDGRVEVAEFAVLLKARGLSDSECGLAFARLDADGDGSISLQEYVDAVYDYYTNPAEGTPGSWLYPRSGRLEPSL